MSRALVVSMPSKLEADKIGGWLARMVHQVSVDPSNGEWGVFVPAAALHRARAAFRRVIAANPSLRLHVYAKHSTRPYLRVGRPQSSLRLASVAAHAAVRAGALKAVVIDRRGKVHFIAFDRRRVTGNPLTAAEQASVAHMADIEDKHGDFAATPTRRSFRRGRAAGMRIVGERFAGTATNPAKMLTKEDVRTLPPLYSQEKVADPIARVKFFQPWGYWTWYATEFDGQDTFFGLVQGHDEEMGYFSLAELSKIRGPGGLRIERDLWFKPTPLSKLRKKPLDNTRRARARRNAETRRKLVHALGAGPNGRYPEWMKGRRQFEQHFLIPFDLYDKARGMLTAEERKEYEGMILRGFPERAVHWVLTKYRKAVQPNPRRRAGASRNPKVPPRRRGESESEFLDRTLWEWAAELSRQAAALMGRSYLYFASSAKMSADWGKDMWGNVIIVGDEGPPSAGWEPASAEPVPVMSRGVEGAKHWIHGILRRLPILPKVIENRRRARRNILDGNGLAAPGKPYILVVMGQRIPVRNWSEASNAVSVIRDRTGLGASKMGDTFPIYKGGKVVAYVSYNAKVWAFEPPNLRDWKKHRLLHDPYKNPRRNAAPGANARRRRNPGRYRRRSARRNPDGREYMGYAKLEGIPVRIAVEYWGNRWRVSGLPTQEGKRTARYLEVRRELKDDWDFDISDTWADQGKLPRPMQERIADLTMPGWRARANSRRRA